MDVSLQYVSEITWPWGQSYSQGLVLYLFPPKQSEIPTIDCRVLHARGCLCTEGMGLRTSISTHRSESMFNKYEFEYTVMTSFTPEVTLKKSGVECGWDLASPYVVYPCLHAQWSHILGLVRGGDKDLSQGVDKPVRVGPSRLLE